MAIDERFKRYDLITGEDTYHSQVAQDPKTSRLLRGFVPSIAGTLKRESPLALFSTALPDTAVGGIAWLFEYDHNAEDGSIIRDFFCATGAYTTDSGSQSPVLYRYAGGLWSVVSDVTLTAIPQAAVVNNLMHLSDGATAWLFDGSTWVKDGFPIPLIKPALSVTTSSPVSSGETSAHTAGLVNPATPNTAGWEYVQNAWRTHPPVQPITDTGWLVASAFNLDLPDDAVPVGIECGCTMCSQDPTNDRIIGVQLFSGETALGTALVPTGAALTSSAKQYTFGGSTELFGWTPDAATMNTSAFGFGVKCSFASDIRLFAWPSFWMKVYYVETGAGILTSRYYWITFADETPGRVHESSSSPISNGSGQATFGNVKITPNGGTCSSSGDKTLTLTAASGLDIASVIGWTVRTQGASGFLSRTITAASASSTTYTLTLDTALNEAISAKPYLIAPPRATHWHIYASDSEGSKMGYLLGSAPVTQFTFTDDSPWMGTDGSKFQKIERPYRNDPAPPSKLSIVHKYRIFRRRETRPNFFTFSAYEEVQALLNGAAEECVCGTDVNTLSDLTNEQSYPKTTTTIRCLVSHADALYIGTEKETIPLLGESLDSFSFSEVTAIRMGMAGRFAAASTHHGLVFLSYDRKLYLYPILMQPWQSMNTEENLVEIGLPKRDIFKTIAPSALDEVWMVHYHFGERDWLVTTFPDKSGNWQTWVFDFDTKGWFKLQYGFVSLAVWEPIAGQKVLVGGGIDGHVYVIDDQDGLYLPSSTPGGGGGYGSLTDNFNRDDGDLGTNWTTYSPTRSSGYQGARISSQQVIPVDFVHYETAKATLPPDQYAQFMVKAVCTGAALAVVLRQSTKSSGWLAAVVADGTFWIDNVMGTQRIASGTMSTALKAGDVLRFEMVGVTMKLTCNGTVVWTGDAPAMLPAGATGVGRAGFAMALDYRMLAEPLTVRTALFRDNFSRGSLPTTGNPQPLGSDWIDCGWGDRLVCSVDPLPVYASDPYTPTQPIVAKAAYSPVDTPAAAALASANLPDNQYASARCVAGYSNVIGGRNGVAVRADASGQNFYWVDWPGGPTWGVRYGKTINGVWTELGSTPNTVYVTANSVVTIQVIGSTITILIDGKTFAELAGKEQIAETSGIFTDTTLTSGRAMLYSQTNGWFGQNPYGFDDFECGAAGLVFSALAIDDFECAGIAGMTAARGEYPEAVFRPALIDFGNPEGNHRFAYVEYECTNPDLPLTVSYWLDPPDVDDPGEPRPLDMTPVMGANHFRGFPNDEGGNVCQRMLIEFRIAQGKDAGALRSIKLAAEPVTDLIVGQ